VIALYLHTTASRNQVRDSSATMYDRTRKAAKVLKARKSWDLVLTGRTVPFVLRVTRVGIDSGKADDDNK